MTTTHLTHRPTVRRRTLVLLLAVALLVGLAAIAAVTGFASGHDGSPAAPGIIQGPHSHHDPARSDYRAAGVVGNG